MRNHLHNEGINSQSGFLQDEQMMAFFSQIMNALPSIVAVLDHQRKLVFSNRSFQENFEISNYHKALRMLPGELFSCVNAKNESGGCGASESCELCGILRTFTESRKSNEKVTRECRILSEEQGHLTAYNFRFTSSPLLVQERYYFVVTIEDISASKRKRELERTFFHDVMNSVNALNGVIRLLKNNSDVEALHLDILEATYNGLLDTIREQKQFLDAEQGMLKIKLSEVDSKDLLIEATLPYIENRTYEASLGIHSDSENITLRTDTVLLQRILGNMIKNALESSEKGDKVWVGAKDMGEAVRFWVSNPRPIPKEVQLQLFERSFSTKGEGRGVGTFSMKLFGEEFLKGKVDFESTAQKGTTFWVELPKEGPK